jgi:hypothetical protein
MYVYEADARKTRTFVGAWASTNDVSLWALEDVRQWSREQLHFQPPLINFAGTINSRAPHPTAAKTNGLCVCAASSRSRPAVSPSEETQP